MADKPEVKKARPNIRQRRVAARLKAWRAATGKTTEEAAAQLRWSAAKLNRFETAGQIAGPAEIIALAAILGVDEEERDRVVTYAVKGQEGLVWWRAFADADTGDDFADFMVTESDATDVWNKEALLMPGLLQDEDYMTRLMRAWNSDDDRIEARRELRRRRQERVTSGALRIKAIIYEAAFHQPFVSRGQKDHLLTMGELPNVTWQVLPAEAAEDAPVKTEQGSPAAGFEAAYHLMKFENEEDVSAVYVENLTSGLYIESRPDVEAYTLNFERLERLALDPNASARWLERAR
ncbi:Helix-turn-helix domain-containing protein [Amycolatopsis pretoriensis]|uniref:Helix-turn-helix domain-containing protein n=1 Tax=Amycolatopsis pretoriensis TaxID=218821 RepID=A0A1H5R7U5_9PSEU|nr:helix-turn-helix transcriptional regulator [Amycolatopsis pretoriensis]SEF34455.1 Helix-turn-helix domain-containing protein [Amycolatopsis pretoriensis]